MRETNVGELGPLARAAMLRRMDSAQARQRAQALLPQEVEARAHAPRASQGEQPAPAAARIDPRARLAGEEPTRPFQVTSLFPHQRVPPDRRSPAGENQDGQTRQELNSVRNELRNLRSEIATLSRLLGRPVRESPAYKGILQQQDPQDTDVRAEAYREAQAEISARAGAAAERRAQREQAVSRLLRQREVQRIEQRQAELLAALKRAEQRLDAAPESLPPGLRDALIGEIYRARYNIALFGGTQALTLLSGLQFNTTA